MEILMRQGQSGWKRVGETKFESEYMLQKLIYESPEVIPVASSGAGKSQPKVFVREAGLPGSGNTDLIGVDEEGSITIIECKLAANREVRRMVVGQLLEYAAHLWQMTYERFDEMCCRAEKWQTQRLADVMQGRVKAMGVEWAEEPFRAGLEANLKEGSFTLIIAVDRINDELRRIIEYLNSRGAGAPRVAVLEIQQFEEGDTQLLVPQVFGTTRVPPPPGRMNEETLLRGASEAYKRLYHGVRSLAVQDAFDSSDFTERGYALRFGGQGNLLVLAPNNYVRMWIGRRLPIKSVDEATNKRLWETLGTIPAIQPKLDKTNPEFGVNDTWDTDHIETFLNAFEALVSPASTT